MRPSACVAVIAVFLACSCAANVSRERNDAVFEPKASSAFVNYFGGDVFIQMTEQDSKAHLYDHRPRSIHIVAPLLDLKKNPSGVVRLVPSSEETKLGDDLATLRVVEYGTLPRIFHVRSGTMQLGQVEASGEHTFGKLKLHLDVIVEDAIDGVSDMHIEGDFTVDVTGIS